MFRPSIDEWLALHDGGCGGHAPALTEREFRRYFECGILAHGFAQARCPDCGHHFIVAYSRKGRGICPSCTTRRMVETAAHLTDQVFRACRYGNGYSRSSKGYAITSTTPNCKTPCCTASCTASNKVCGKACR